MLGTVSMLVGACAQSHACVVLEGTTRSYQLCHSLLLFHFSPVCRLIMLMGACSPEGPWGGLYLGFLRLMKSGSVRYHTQQLMRMMSCMRCA